jgi:hypothetical protein
MNGNGKRSSLKTRIARIITMAPKGTAAVA